MGEFFDADEINTMVEWRQWLHRYPELGFEEHKTSAYVAEKLRGLGLEVRTGLAGTGMVTVIEGHHPADRSIGLRADMDALPISEDQSRPNCSTHPGRMHACGHDGHTAMLMGAAIHLAKNRDFAGRVNLIFQPAEEGLGGGERMVAEGLFDEFPCDEVYAVHNVPQIPLGYAVVHDEMVFAGLDNFDIEIVGQGGHVAVPHECVDPVIVTSQLVLDIQQIAARRVNPVDPVVVGIGFMQAGETANAIGGSGKLSGTVRHFSNNTSETVAKEMKRIVEGVSKATGAEINLTYKQLYRPTVNTPEQAEHAAQCVEKVLGENSVFRNPPPAMSGEDFSFMLEKCPGAYILIGQGAPNHQQPIHTAGYDFNDELLPLGASYFIELVKHRLAPDRAA